MVTTEKHQRSLLGGLERFIGTRGKENPKIYDETSKVLILIYNADLVDEDIVKKWGSRASKKYIDLATSKKVRKSADVFLTWLNEAESDDESE